MYDDDSEWQEWFPTPVAPGIGWAILETVHVKGTAFRRETAGSYLTAVAKAHDAGRFYGIAIEREPGNPRDPNALRVIGVVDGERGHIGYVPAEIAAGIAADYPADMPLRGGLHRISWIENTDKFAIFVVIFRPAKRSQWWRDNMPG